MECIKVFIVAKYRRDIKSITNSIETAANSIIKETCRATLELTRSTLCLINLYLTVSRFFLRTNGKTIIRTLAGELITIK